MEIEDKIPLTQSDKEQMFVDILPQTEADDGVAYLSFYLEPEEDKEKILSDVRKELEDNYLPKERIRWGVQTAEQNTIMMMDVLNTLLWLFNAKNCYRVGEITHPVIKESKDELKKKIAHFKQKSDERKSKESQ